MMEDDETTAKQLKMLSEHGHHIFERTASVTPSLDGHVVVLLTAK